MATLSAQQSPPTASRNDFTRHASEAASGVFVDGSYASVYQNISNRDNTKAHYGNVYNTYYNNSKQASTWMKNTRPALPTLGDGFLAVNRNEM